MDMTVKNRNGVFSQLDGTIAQILIIAGLVLLLAAPLVPRFKSARVAGAQTELSQLDAMMDLDMEDLRRAQEKERKDEADQARRDNVGTNYSLTPEQFQKQQQERQAREEKRQEKERERQKAFDDKKEELKKKYDSNAKRRELLEAQSAAAGARWHLVLMFLGNAMLLIGLLVVTLQSEGTRQKVALVILLVVMFSALSGVNLTFLTAGNLGDRQGFERLLKSP